MAEFFNTFSNLFFASAGAIGLFFAIRAGHEKRCLALWLGLVAIGIGSGTFHGTLSHVGQQGDETPMIWTIIAWLYGLFCMDVEYEKRHPVLCAGIAWLAVAACAVWTVAHYYMRFVLVFQVGFGVLVALGLGLLYFEWRRCTDATARALALVYVGTLVVAFTLWILDQQFCEHLHDLPLGVPNPQFHAWWHTLVAVNCYCGPLFATFQRQVALGKKPRIRWVGGVLPFVESQDE